MSFLNILFQKLVVFVHDDSWFYDRYFFEFWVTQNL